MKTIFFTIASILTLIILSGCSTTTLKTESSRVYPPGSDKVGKEGLKQYVEPWEDGLRSDPNGDSFEWWYFDFTLSDSSTVVIVFSTKDILKPSGKPDPQVSISITTPDGKRISDSDKPGFAKFSALKDRCYVRIGKSSVSGDLQTYRLIYDHGGIYAELKMVSRAPPWRPGDGKMYFDAKRTKYFAWLPALPYGDVRGRIGFNGEIHEVSGTAYHDHNWGNVRLDRVMTQWYWGRAHIGDYTTIFSQILTSPEYGSMRVPVFYLAKGNRILSDESFQMVLSASKWKTHSGGREFPQEIEIAIQQKNGQFLLRLSKPQIIEAKSFLEDLPIPLQLLVRLFDNPYYFRFKTKLTLLISLVPGAADTTYRDEVAAGSAIFEMMLLKGKHTVR